MESFAQKRFRFRIATAVLLVGTGVVGSAQGFYFKGWPGDGIPRETTLVEPKAPPYENPPGVPPGPGEPPKEPPEKPRGNPPPEVPEPATGLAALIGLTALAATRRMLKKR